MGTFCINIHTTVCLDLFCVLLQQDHGGMSLSLGLHVKSGLREPR